MKHIYCLIFGTMLLTLVNSSLYAQNDSLSDDDIVSIKIAAEKQLSELETIMNQLITPDLLSMVRVSLIKDGIGLFTPNARVEVDYDTAYFPPNTSYEVDIAKYLGDFATYHKETAKVTYTNRQISDIKFKKPEGFYYLTIAYYSVYGNLPPQQRVATLMVEQGEDGWTTPITYVKFKNSPASPFANLPAFTPQPDSIIQVTDNTPVDTLSVPDTQPKKDAQVFLNNLSSGGKRGERYLLGWELPESNPATVQLMLRDSIMDTIITAHNANILQWSINEKTKPGRYQIKVVDDRNMASVTSPAFTISRRFPMALRVGLGVAVGFYVVQAIRNDWDFGWPFSGEAPPIDNEVPILPDPPGLPE